MHEDIKSILEQVGMIQNNALTQFALYTSEHVFFGEGKLHLCNCNGDIDAIIKSYKKRLSDESA